MKEKFVVSFISNLSSNLIFIIASYLIVLTFDVAILGTWFFLNSVVSLGFLFVDICFDKIHYQYSGEKNISEYFGTFFTIKIMLIIINVIISLIIITILQLWSSTYYILILFLLISKILFKIGNTFLINLRAKIKIFKSEIPVFINIFGKSLSNIFLILNISYFDPLYYMCVSNLIFDIIFIVIILSLSKNDYKINKPKKELFFSYLKDTRPLLIFSIFFVIATNLGNLILDYSFGHESVSYFSLVNIYIIPILLLITGSLITIYLTLFSRFFKKGDIASIRVTTHVIEKYSSIIFLSIILIVFLNGELIFSIFLSKYINSLPILYIMIFIPYFVGISQPYAYQMISGKKQKTFSYMSSLIYLLIILLMLVFIIKNSLLFQAFSLDPIGYALSQTIPWILWVVLSRYYSKKYFKIPSQKKILLHLLLAFITFSLSFFLKNLLIDLFSQYLIFLLIFSSLITIGIFLGLLFLIKELKREDIIFFLQLIQFQRYKNSFKEEFAPSIPS